MDWNQSFKQEHGEKPDQWGIDEPRVSGNRREQKLSRQTRASKNNVSCDNFFYRFKNWRYWEERGNEAELQWLASERGVMFVHRQQSCAPFIVQRDTFKTSLAVPHRHGTHGTTPSRLEFIAQTVGNLLVRQLCSKQGMALAKGLVSQGTIGSCSVKEPPGKTENTAKQLIHHTCGK